jgi:hypothetical protein
VLDYMQNTYLAAVRDDDGGARCTTAGGRMAAIAGLLALLPLPWGW